MTNKNTQSDATLVAPYSPQNRIRIVTAAALFDGHDAAINIMRRILQASGAEVIHLGHNRSVREIVHAAVQEDATAIALSSYQGGHVEFFTYTMDLLRKLGCGHIQVFGGGGGTITPDEITHLQNKAGVNRIYSPEDGRKMGLQGILNDLLERSDRHPLEFIDWENLLHYKTNPRSLGHALTCLETEAEHVLEKDRPQIARLKEDILKNQKKARVIGITGPGGAGKSSFTDEIVLRLLHRFPQARIGVLAVDPTRKKTGGALLGDRLRMNSLQNDRTFMRSLATRQSDKAISQATSEAIALFQASAFDWILVETGGTGQADTSIVEEVDANIYVMTSEYGAASQLEKINMLDYADMVVLNKFEKSGSLDALEDIRKQLARNHPTFLHQEKTHLPVFGTIASRFADPGLNQAFNHLIEIVEHSKGFCLTQDRVDPLSTPVAPIIPRERVNYLSEISSTIESYHKKVEGEVERFRQWEALETVVEQHSLSPSTLDELEQTRQQLAQQIDESTFKTLQTVESQLSDYAQDKLTYQVRDKTIEVDLKHLSLSHIGIPKVATPGFKNRSETLRFALLENLPGFFPYTAGVFPFKRKDEDPKRMFAGEGTPERTNKRFHLLCKGETSKRLSTAFDSVTLYGEDPDVRPDIFGKIGESGVSVCTLEDAKILYRGFDLCDPNVSVSMTINGPAPILLAFYFNAAIDQQVDLFSQKQGRAPSKQEYEQIRRTTLKQVRGTVQADILKEDQAQNTCIFSTPFALKMMGDIQTYFTEHEVRNFYSVSISGYHIAEAGANPITQLAFTLANGFTFVEYYLARGLHIDDFAANLSFFFSNGLDPEYTVIGRVARRIWAIALKERYKANSRSQKLKYHIQTSGRSLHAQEMDFNDIRTTLQALIAYFDACNSLHTNAYDEAVTTPTQESVRRAMAIQLIISKELGWAKNENPLQGSFLIEELTELVEQAVLQEFERLSQRGGVLGAMETQYQRNKIQEESLLYEQQKHSGELPIVGVNTFLNPDSHQLTKTPEALSRATWEEKNHQIEALGKFKAAHKDQSDEALERLKKAAREGDNIFEVLMDTVRVASLGQISQALYEVGGQYRRSN